MAAPTIKRFSRGDRLHVQAQRIWLILVAHVMQSERDSEGLATICYGDLATTMGYEDRRAGHTLGRQLGIIAKLCVDNDLPPLNSLVVNQATGLPGDHVLLRPGKGVRAEQVAVMDFDWFSIRVPTTGTFRRVWESWA